MALTVTLTIPLQGRTNPAVPPAGTHASTTTCVSVTGGGLTPIIKTAQTTNDDGLLTFADAQTVTNGATLCVTMWNAQYIRRLVKGTVAAGALTIDLSNAATFTEVEAFRRGGQAGKGYLSGGDTGYGASTLHENEISEMGYAKYINEFGGGALVSDISGNGAVAAEDASILVANGADANAASWFGA